MLSRCFNNAFKADRKEMEDKWTGRHYTGTVQND